METRVCRLHAQGDLRIETIDTPDPGPGQALVRIARGGICGSDLHYFQDGGFGPIRVREPIILGHEIAGRVEAVGPGVEGLAPGTLVALNPSRPCGACRFCAGGQPQHCLTMRFLGSAMRFPHEQGAFRDRMIADAAQCVPTPGATAAAAACAEPLAVCLHAVAQAGDLAGARVLVTGSGPIGCLTVAAAKLAGAAEVVATDLHDAPLAAARAMGADRTANVRTDAEALEPDCADKGGFDVAFECSAAAPAIALAIRAVRPRGAVVQLGVAGDTAIPLNLLVGKEIRLAGSHRFHAEFAQAAALIAAGRIDPAPMLTGVVPMERAAEAMAEAGDRSRAVKVQLDFDA